MAQNTRVQCPKGVWTKLTNALVTGDVSVMLASSAGVSLQATAGAGTAPTINAGPLELLTYGDGWSGGSIESKFPGVAAADTLWARPRSRRDSTIGISHA